MTLRFPARRTVAPALVAGGLLLASPAHAHPINGTWVLTVSEEDVQKRLTEAVDTAASQLNLLIREIGRSKLTNAANFCKVYRFALTDTSFSVQCDSRDPYARPLEGDQPATGRDGEPIQSRLKLEPSAAHLAWLAESGRRDNTFRVEGDQLQLRARVSSDRMDEPMRWNLEYRRLTE